ncbi:MAG: hypothetical protein ABJG68_06370 [Crocinitomicaceae bacterium]
MIDLLGRKLYSFCLLLVLNFSAYAGHLDNITAHYELDSIKNIDLQFKTFPVGTDFLKINLLSFSGSGFDIYRPYSLINSNKGVIYPKSSEISLENLNITGHSRYFVFYIQYYSKEGRRIEEEYYRKENKKNRAMITLDIGEVQLVRENEDHSFIWSWQSGKDSYWSFYFLDRRFETPMIANRANLPAMQLHWVTSDLSLDSVAFSAKLQDDEFMGANLMVEIEKRYLSFSIDTSDQIVCADEALKKPCKFLFRITPIYEIPIKEVYNDPNVHSFKYVNQMDTLINGSMLRKIDFEVESSLDSVSARLKSNQYLLGWYIQNGKSSHKVCLDSGKTKFSLVYPTRHHSENMNSFRVELTDNSYTPFKPSIEVPFVKADVSKFQFFKVSRGSRNRKMRGIRWYVFIGNFDSFSTTGFNDYQAGLVAGCENYDSEKYYQNPQLNIHQNEYLTFVFTNTKGELLKTFVLPFSSQKLDKKKIAFRINNDLKFKLKISKSPYLAPKFNVNDNTFSHFQTDMDQAIKIPQLYRNKSLANLNKTRDLDLRW